MVNSSSSAIDFSKKLRIIRNFNDYVAMRAPEGCSAADSDQLMKDYQGALHRFTVQFPVVVACKPATTAATAATATAATATATTAAMIENFNSKQTPIPPQRKRVEPATLSDSDCVAMKTDPATSGTPHEALTEAAEASADLQAQQVQKQDINVPKWTLLADHGRSVAAVAAAVAGESVGQSSCVKAASSSASSSLETGKQTASEEEEKKVKFMLDNISYKDGRFFCVNDSTAGVVELSTEVLASLLMRSSSLSLSSSSAVAAAAAAVPLSRTSSQFGQYEKQETFYRHSVRKSYSQNLTKVFGKESIQYSMKLNDYVFLLELYPRVPSNTLKPLCWDSIRWLLTQMLQPRNSFIIKAPINQADEEYVKYKEKIGGKEKDGWSNSTASTRTASAAGSIKTAPFLSLLYSRDNQNSPGTSNFRSNERDVKRKWTTVTDSIAGSFISAVYPAISCKAAAGTAPAGTAAAGTAAVPPALDRMSIPEIKEYRSRMGGYITDEVFAFCINQLEVMTGTKDCVPVETALAELRLQLGGLTPNTFVLKEVIEYWKHKRVQLGKPLLREFWPVPSANDNSPFAVFRARTKERTVLRRPKRTLYETSERLKRLTEDFNVTDKLFEAVKRRDMLKLQLCDLDFLLFEQLWKEQQDPNYSHPAWVVAKRHLRQARGIIMNEQQRSSSSSSISSSTSTSSSSSTSSNFGGCSLVFDESDAPQAVKKRKMMKSESERMLGGLSAAVAVAVAAVGARKLISTAMDIEGFGVEENKNEKSNERDINKDINNNEYYDYDYNNVDNNDKQLSSQQSPLQQPLHFQDVSAPAIVVSTPTTGCAPAITGSVPAITGSVPAITGSVPAITGSAPAITGSAPATTVGNELPLSHSHSSAEGTTQETLQSSSSSSSFDIPTQPKKRFRSFIVSQPSESAAAAAPSSAATAASTTAAAAASATQQKQKQQQQQRILYRKGRTFGFQKPVFKSPVPLPPILLGLSPDCSKESLEAALRAVGVYCMEPVGIWDSNSYMLYKQKENLLSTETDEFHESLLLKAKANILLQKPELIADRFVNPYYSVSNPQFQITCGLDSSVKQSENLYYNNQRNQYNQYNQYNNQRIQSSTLVDFSGSAGAAGTAGVYLKKEEQQQPVLYLYRQSLEWLPRHLRHPVNLRLVAPFAQQSQSGLLESGFSRHAICGTAAGLNQYGFKSNSEITMQQQLGFIRSSIRKGRLDTIWIDRYPFVIPTVAAAVAAAAVAAAATAAASTVVTPAIVSGSAAGSAAAAARAPNAKSSFSSLNPFDGLSALQSPQQQQQPSHHLSTDAAGSSAASTFFTCNSTTQTGHSVPNPLQLPDQSKAMMMNLRLSPVQSAAAAATAASPQSPPSLPVFYSSFSSYGFCLVSPGSSNSELLLSDLCEGEYGNSGFYPAGVGSEFSLVGVGGFDREAGMTLPLGFDTLSNTGGFGMFCLPRRLAIRKRELGV